jgi:hypothetical protein
MWYGKGKQEQAIQLNRKKASNQNLMRLSPDFLSSLQMKFLFLIWAQISGLTRGSPGWTPA